MRAAQAQTRPLQLQAVAVPALLEEALADHRAQAAAAGVTLQLVANQAEVTLDRLLVARAIGNLVSNAIKHAPRDSRVEVSARRDTTQFSVQVLDTGMGLNPAQMAQLAEGEQGAGVRDARGVGLGLLFVQRVARRHGGQLRALPPPQGTGACFRLELPV